MVTVFDHTAYRSIAVCIEVVLTMEGSQGARDWGPGLWRPDPSSRPPQLPCHCIPYRPPACSRPGRHGLIRSPLRPPEPSVPIPPAGLADARTSLFASVMRIIGCGLKRVIDENQSACGRPAGSALRMSYPGLRSFHCRGHKLRAYSPSAPNRDTTILPWGGAVPASAATPLVGAAIATATDRHHDR